MAVDTDIETIRHRLAEIMARKGVKPTTLSLAVGKSPTLVKDLMEKTQDVKLSTLSRLAESLGVDLSELLANDNEVTAGALGPRLFVKGEVAAGVWREAYEFPASEWQTFYGRPDVTADTDHRFGLRVVGDSMNEVYPPNSIIECVSVFGHVEPTPGKRVVVIRTRENGEVEATVKELVEMNGEMWAVPRSSNPAHAPIKLNGKVGDVIETRIAAVVVSSVRPE